MEDNEKTKEQLVVEGELRHNYEIQSAINSLLQLSLKDVSLEDFLKEALGLILSIQWLTFDSIGTIFLVENDPGVLVMKAYKGITPQIQKTCSRVAFGSCVCGIAADTRKARFTDCLGDEHAVKYEGIVPHGHYCVPILFGGETIGVINIYLHIGHKYNSREEDFLTAAANTLAGVIQRKRGEDELKTAYAKLEATQSQLIQMEKMRVVGTLVSGVAHELKNPLAIIIQGINYLEKDTGLNKEKQMEVLGIIKEAVARSDRIIRGLLNFSKISLPKSKLCRIENIIEAALNLVSEQLALSDIRITRDFAAKFSCINADESQMQQVFANIILNSLQAMPEKGELIFRTYNRDFTGLKDGSGRNAREYFHAADTALVCEIADTGAGIPQDLLSRVFDPFFTTRPLGQGIGLGLSISRSIIDSHKGLINIESDAGKGAKVIITLPLVAEEKAAPCP